MNFPLVLALCFFCSLESVVFLHSLESTSKEAEKLPYSGGYGPLGPLVINHDGTARRIANWGDMTVSEQKTTAERIMRRNRQRSALLKGAEKDDL